ncbi:hypothetical protein FOG50_03104 [Hanseniaspora uvarum]|nr:hypothetical protein FOG50_03104 [Hanseniaspora uvarum]
MNVNCENNDFDQLQYSNTQFIDYIEVNEGLNLKNYKLKSFSSSIEKLLTTFDNELIAAFNSNVSGSSYENFKSSDLNNGSQTVKSLGIISLDNRQDSNDNGSGDDWADYISRLGKLNKLLSTLSTEGKIDVLPYSDQINKHLIISLNKNLPSGVHIKTLQIYLQIFEIIGLNNLNKQFDLWILGLLPVMEFCKMSVKKTLVDDVFGKWILKLEEGVLKKNLTPLIKCLFSGVEKDTNDVLALINNLKLAVADDVLFMKCVCNVLIEAGLQGNGLELKMNCLIWLNDSVDNNFLLCIKDDCDSNRFLKAIVECLKVKNTSSNSDDVLCCRGYLDYLIKNQLYFSNETIFDYSNDGFAESSIYLIDSLMQLLLNKDVSINRRIFQYMVPQDDTLENIKLNGKQYFEKYLFNGLVKNLHDNYDTLSIITILKLLVIKWEDIGSLVFENLIIKIMHEIDLNSEIAVNSLSQLFEIVDSHLILQALINKNNQEHDFENQLVHIEKMINIIRDDDDEMLVKHFPMLMMFLMTSENFAKNEMYTILIDKIVKKVPQRAYFTIAEESTIPNCADISNNDIENYHKTLQSYYSIKTADFGNAQKSLPYHISDFLSIAVKRSYDTLIEFMKKHEKLGIDSKFLDLNIKLFQSFYTRLEEFQKHKYIDYEKINNLLLAFFTNPNLKLEYELFIQLISLYKTCIFSKVFGFDKTKLESINQSLNVIKTFKVIISNVIYPKLFDNSISFEYVLVLNQMISINEKYSIKFLLESLLKDTHNKNERKLKMLETLIFKKNSSDKNSQNFGFFIQFVDHLLLLDNPSLFKWLKEYLSDTSNSVYFSKLIDHYCIKLVSNGSDIKSNDYFNPTLQSLLSLVTNVIGEDLNYLTKEFISSNLKITIQDFNKTQFLTSNSKQTYQSLMINILLQRLVHSKSFVIVDDYADFLKILTLFEKLLIGDEFYIISDIINTTFAILKQNLSNSNTDCEEFTKCKVILIKILIKLITNSDISDKNDLILKFLDFIVSSIDLIKNYEVMSNFIYLLQVSYIQLDGNGIIGSEESLISSEDDFGVSLNKNKIIFNIVLPLGTTLLTKLQSEFENELDNMDGNNFDFFNILLDGISELLETCNNQIKEQKISVEHESNTFRSKNDFFSSVFNSNSRKQNEIDSIKSKMMINEQIVDQYFNMTIKKLYELWSLTNLKIQELKNEQAFNCTSLVMIIQNYKHKVKTFLQHNYNTRPVLLLNSLINNNTDVFKELSFLIVSLDGNRPSLTIPKILDLIDNNHLNVVYFDFIESYLNLLETSTIEEVFNDIFEFFKSNVSLLALDGHLGVQSIKILSKVGTAIKFDSKKTNTVFFELMAKIVSSYISANQNTILNDFTNNPSIIKMLETYLVPLFKNDINDLVINVVYTKIVAELFNKKKQSLENINEFLLDFLIIMTPYLSGNKGYKSIINSILSSNSNEFEIFEYSNKWSEYLTVILKSTLLPEYTNNLINELFTMKNTFNWSKQEMLTKNINLIKKIIILVNIGCSDNASTLLIDFILKNYDFKNIELYKYQVHLMSTILVIGDLSKNINFQEFVEFVVSGLRNFYHYYIHNKGVITNLKEDNAYDMSFYYLLKIITDNKNLLIGKNAVWTNLSVFKELVIVDGTDDVKTWIKINSFEDVGRFILSFDTVLINEMKNI